MNTTSSSTYSSLRSTALKENQQIQTNNNDSSYLIPWTGSNSINKPGSLRRESLGDGNNVAINLLKKQIAEHEKRATYLERKIVGLEAQVKALQENQTKIKFSEKNAKILLSSRETAARRQSIILKQASDAITKLTERELDRLRRSKLARDELEKEFEILQDQMETMSENYDVRIKDIQNAHGQEIAALTTAIEATSGEYEARLFQMTHEHSNKIEKLQAELNRMLESKNDEKLAKLTEQLDECLNSNAQLSQQICQLKYHEEVKETQYKAAIAALELSLQETNSAKDFSLSVAQNESSLLKTHLDECLAARHVLESDLATVQIKLSEASATIWQLQDKADSEQENQLQKEQELLSTVADLKNDLLNMEMGQTGEQHVKAMLEDKLSEAIAHKQLQDMTVSDLNRRISQLEQQLSYKGAELRAVQDSNDALLSELSQLKSSMSQQEANKEEISDLNAQLYARDQEIGIMSAELHNLEGTLEEERSIWTGKVDYLKNEVEIAHMKHAQARQEADMFQEEVAVLQSNLQEALDSSFQLEETPSTSLTLIAHPDVDTNAELTTIRTTLAEKTNEVHALTIKLETLSDAFEKTRGARPHAQEAPVGGKDLQLLLQRSDAELIKRASKNASLQYEVNRLTELLNQTAEGDKKGVNFDTHKALTEEAERLSKDLVSAKLKLERVNQMNHDLTSKLKCYHDITNALQSEMAALHKVNCAEADQRISDLVASLTTAEQEVKRCRIIAAMQESMIRDKKCSDYTEVEERLTKLDLEMLRWQEKFESYQQALSPEEMQSVGSLRSQITKLTEERNTSKIENIRLKSEFDKLITDYEFIMGGGHVGNKQKIHYISGLKEQISGLLSENAALKAATNLSK